MALTSGTLLGPYEIVEAIGAGGMGEVYRARDTKLGRDVAIKVLPDEFARDRDRLDRFEREARLLAQLNHANVATLYGLEVHDAQPFLIMELVEGETLAERVAQGPLPIDEATALFVRIADGLEAAHDKGIIHRDLKPANIKISPDANPKILDFGLAKAFAPEGDVSAETSQSPTLTKGTALGAIMGTASYMSPEQARGKVVDRRADVWAFGCCLYEALTGSRAFDGESVTDILAAVINGEPDLGALPDGVRAVVARCLRKDLRRRVQHIGDARIGIEEATSGTAASDAPVRRSSSRMLLLMLMLAPAMAATALWFLVSSDTDVSREVVRSELPISLTLEQPGSFTPGIAISPDGRYVAYVYGALGRSEIRLRKLDELEALVVPASRRGRSPFFSPDSRWLGFVVGGSLMKVPLSGGAPTEIVEHFEGGGIRGLSWGDDGSIVFTGGNATGLSRVSADGGDVETLTRTNVDRREKSHRLMDVLPGSGGILFTVVSSDVDTFDDASIAVFSRKTGEYKVLVEGGSNPRFSASGHLLYARAGTILAVPFDVSTLEVQGTPVTVIDDAATSPIYGNAEFSVSRNGTLVYAPGGAWGDDYRVAWLHRDGRVERLIEGRGRYAEVALSPDERALAVTIEGVNPSIWKYDIERGTMTRMVSGFGNDWVNWTPDGQRISFRSNRRGPHDLYWQRADGSGPAEPIIETEHAVWSSSWSPDGRTIVYAENRPGTGLDIWRLSLESGQGPELLLGASFNEGYPVISPDGEWLAYTSDESGRNEVYVQRFSHAAGKRQVSVEGGVSFRWHPDGRSLYFGNPDMGIMEVAIDTRGELVLGQPREIRRPVLAMDVARDGRLVVIERSPELERAPNVVLVQNWFEELERLVPTEN